MCWNEAEEGSGRTVFKAWEDRMDRDEMLESDVDPELLFHIPLVSLPHHKTLPPEQRLYYLPHFRIPKKITLRNVSARKSSIA